MPDAITFARRPGEIYGRVVPAVIFLVVIVFLLRSLAGLIVLLLSGRSALAMGTRLMAVPILAVAGFLLYLVGMGAWTLRRAFADRHLPLVTLDGEGVTLHRVNPVTVPWAEITGAGLERGMRGATTLLRINVRDSQVSEQGGNGRIIDLRALAVPPADLLAAIQAHPGFRPSSPALP